jgi:hypothetical protein
MSKRFVNYKDESRKDWGLYRENHEDNSSLVEQVSFVYSALTELKPKRKRRKMPLRKLLRKISRFLKKITIKRRR